MNETIHPNQIPNNKRGSKHRRMQPPPLQIKNTQLSQSRKQALFSLQQFYERIQTERMSFVSTQQHQEWSISLSSFIDLKNDRVWNKMPLE